MDPVYRRSFPRNYESQRSETVFWWFTHLTTNLFAVYFFYHAALIDLS